MSQSTQCIRGSYIYIFDSANKVAQIDDLFDHQVPSADRDVQALMCRFKMRLISPAGLSQNHRFFPLDHGDWRFSLSIVERRRIHRKTKLLPFDTNTKGPLKPSKSSNNYISLDELQTALKIANDRHRQNAEESFRESRAAEFARQQTQVLPRTIAQGNFFTPHLLRRDDGRTCEDPTEREYLVVFPSGSAFLITNLSLLSKLEQFSSKKPEPRQLQRALQLSKYSWQPLGMVGDLYVLERVFSPKVRAQKLMRQYLVKAGSGVIVLLILFYLGVEISEIHRYTVDTMT